MTSLKQKFLDALKGPNDIIGPTGDEYYEAGRLSDLHLAVADCLNALEWIAVVNACDYEYQAKSREALARLSEVMEGK